MVLVPFRTIRDYCIEVMFQGVQLGPVLTSHLGMPALDPPCLAAEYDRSICVIERCFYRAPIFASRHCGNPKIAS